MTTPASRSASIPWGPSPPRDRPASGVDLDVVDDRHHGPPLATGRPSPRTAPRRRRSCRPPESRRAARLRRATGRPGDDRRGRMRAIVAPLEAGLVNGGSRSPRPPTGPGPLIASWPGSPRTWTDSTASRRGSLGIGLRMAGPGAPETIIGRLSPPRYRVGRATGKDGRLDWPHWYTCLANEDKPGSTAVRTSDLRLGRSQKCCALSLRNLRLVRRYVACWSTLSRAAATPG